MAILELRPFKVPDDIRDELKTSQIINGQYRLSPLVIGFIRGLLCAGVSETEVTNWLRTYFGDRFRLIPQK